MTCTSFRSAIASCRWAARGWWGCWASWRERSPARAASEGRGRRGRLQPEVDHERQMVRRPPRRLVPDHARFLDPERPLAIDLVQPGDGEEGGEGAVALHRVGDLLEAVPAEARLAQGVAPVVEIAGDQGG